MTISEELANRCVREYMIAERNCGPIRCEELREVLRNLTATLPYELDELQARDVVEYIAKMRSRGLGANTIALFYWTVCAYWKWAYKAGVMEAQDYYRFTEITSAKWVKSKPKPYSKRELETFFGLLDKHSFIKRLPERGQKSTFLERWLDGTDDRFGRVQSHLRKLQFDAQIALALEHGLRYSEICASTLAQVHPDNRAVVTRTAKQRHGVVKIRETPFTKHSREAISAWANMRVKLPTDHDSLWLKLQAPGPLDPQLPRSVTQVFAYWNTHAPATQWGWHRFRHTFGTSQLRAGVPIETLRELMGHANIQTTLLYTEISVEDVLQRTEEHSDEFERLLGFR
jgi:site-specific recombinase XerD